MDKHCLDLQKNTTLVESVLLVQDAFLAVICTTSFAFSQDSQNGLARDSRYVREREVCSNRITRNGVKRTI